MYSKKLISQRDIPIFLFSILFSIFSIFQAPKLEAGGWGNTKEVHAYKGLTWDGIFFDMNGFSFSASIPNYNGSLLQDGMIHFGGNGEEKGYLIAGTINPDFKTPKSAKEFVKIIQDANPDYVVQIIEDQELGAKYAVDLIPKKQETNAFWRFLVTKDRFIKMGTEDVNPNRRDHFFKSMRIHK